MRLHLLGTGSPSGWPPVFSDEPMWEEARRLGGANLRGRSGAIIDDDIKIDFSADTVAQVKQHGRNLAKVRTILFTHHHADHVYPEDLSKLAVPPTYRSRRNFPTPQPIDIYANEATTNKITRVIDPEKSDVFKFHLIKAGDSFETSGGAKVLAMPAQHEQGAMLFRIQRGGKTLFYGHDSGSYPQQTLDALADGTVLDIALLDCNFTDTDIPNNRHMNVERTTQMAAKLRESGAITPKTRCIATHFSSFGKMLHEQLKEELAKYDIETAYDGMVVEV